MGSEHPVEVKAVRMLSPLRVLCAAVALSALTSWAGTGQAAAQTQRQDRLQLESLTSSEVVPGGKIHFTALLNYNLQTAQRAFVLIFLFEDNDQSSTQDAADARWADVGSGQLTVGMDYTPRRGVRNLTMVIGMFKDEKNMLASASTTPLSVADWRGRAAFEAAMQARIAGDHAEAIDALSFAIDLSPDIGTLYYWRADSFIRLRQYDDAILDYQEALRLIPGDRASQVGLGTALLWREDWSAAITQLTQAIEQPGQPDRWTAWAYRGRGVGRAAQGGYTDAISDYQAYLTIIPDAGDRAEVEGWIAELRARL
jgi:tetratricopeptide (TPR) repeat protein